MTTLKIQYPFPVRHKNIHDHIDIAYCDEGKGDQTILFLHGLANYIPTWKHQIKTLREHYRCIAVDLPGNGLSSRGHYPYTMFFYAESVVRFIEKMELNNVVLCGHSMGGQIAIIIALRHPQLISKLILVAPAGFEYFNQHEVMMIEQGMSIGNIFYSDEFHLESAIRQSFYQSNSESHHIINDLKSIMKHHPLKQWSAMTQGSVSGMLKEQVSQYIQNIECPTHILFGEKDHFIPNQLIHSSLTPERVAKFGEAMIKKSSLELLPDAGHFVHIEKYNEVNESIIKFLKS